MPRLKSQRPQRAPWFRYSDAASVGIEMVVAITICALGALWLERNVTHWSPWTSILGILIGVGAAAKAVLRAARIPERATPGSDAQSQQGAAADPSSEPAQRRAEDRHGDAPP